MTLEKIKMQRSGAGFLAIVVTDENWIPFGKPKIKERVAFSANGDDWFWKDTFRKIPLNSFIERHLRFHHWAFASAEKIGVFQP